MARVIAGSLVCWSMLVRSVEALDLSRLRSSSPPSRVIRSSASRLNSSSPDSARELIFRSTTLRAANWNYSELFPSFISSPDSSSTLDFSSGFTTRLTTPAPSTLSLPSSFSFPTTTNPSPLHETPPFVSTPPQLTSTPPPLSPQIPRLPSISPFPPLPPPPLPPLPPLPPVVPVMADLPQNARAMPTKNQSSAPKFDTTKPRELSAYFQELERLMTAAQ